MAGAKALFNRFKARLKGQVDGTGAGSGGGKNAKLAKKNRTLQQVRQRMAKKDQEIADLRALLAERDNAGSSVRTENVVWIFGSGRTGSTWIAAMMEEMKNQTVWFEPRVGLVFEPHRFERYRGNHFILSPQYKEIWLSSIRNFVLDGIGARFPHLAGPDNYLVIKEPGGSAAAALLMEALPESRMVLLVRDPRDVVASWLEAYKEGGWQYERGKGDRRQQAALADRNPDAFVEKHANAYLRDVGGAKEAYDAHQGRKALVRYEELRANTLGTMRRMYAELEVPVEEGALARSVQRHAWENIPKKKKGEGKFYRKAKPGGWREDLTPEQARIVERITAPLLKEFYPSWEARPHSA